MKTKAICLITLALLAGLTLAAPDSTACRMIDWLDVPGLDWRVSNSDMAMGDSFLVWCPGTDIYYLVNPFSQTEVETLFARDYGSMNAKSVALSDSFIYMGGGGQINSKLYSGDSLIFLDMLYVPFASFHYAVIRDTFLYTASTDAYGLHCINIANPESIFVVCTAPYFFGEYGMEVIDSFVYTATPSNVPIGPEPTEDSRPNWQISIVKLIGDTSAVGESLLFVENRCYGGIGSNGELLFYVSNYLSDFIYPGTDQVLGAPSLGVWGEDYSYTWEEPDSEIVYGLEVLNDTILAVGFHHGFSIINYTQLGGMTEVAYYREIDSVFAFTHFARKGNRLYAMAHPHAGISRMYMFELDSTIWTGISDPAQQTSLPEAFEISAHPNPFNSAVTIALDIPVGDGSPAPISVEIYDVNGRRVSVIGNYDQSVIARRASPDEAISYECEKDCFGQSPRNDNAGEVVWRPDESLPSGVYLVRATAGGRGDLDPTGTVAAARVVYLK